MTRAYFNPGRIMRFAFAFATIVFGSLGFALEARGLLAAAGAFGLLWTVWDVIWHRVLAPFGQWAADLLTGGTGGPSPNTRPTIDDMVRLSRATLRTARHAASRSRRRSGWRRSTERFERTR